MSSKPRNVRYFPRMKVRGAKRRIQAPLLRVVRAFDALNGTFSDAAKTMKKFAFLLDQREVTIHE